MLLGLYWSYNKFRWSWKTWTNLFAKGSSSFWLLAIILHFQSTLMYSLERF